SRCWRSARRRTSCARRSTSPSCTRSRTSTASTTRSCTASAGRDARSRLAVAGPQHEVGERGGSFPPRERLLLGGPALPVRGVGLAVAAERAFAPFGVVAVDPPGVVGGRTRRAGDRPAALDDERGVAPDVRGLAGGAGDPVPPPPPALADDAGHGGRARGAAVPAGVDPVERDDPRPCAAGERAGELGLARTRAAVDEQ